MDENGIVDEQGNKEIREYLQKCFVVLISLMIVSSSWMAVVSAKSNKEPDAMPASGPINSLDITNNASPLAVFSTAKGMNVAQLEDGARIVGFSSSTSNIPENAIDSNIGTAWGTSTGNVTNQWIKVQLAGNRTHIVDRVVLKGSSNWDSPKNFEIRVSNNSTNDLDFTTIFTGTVPQDNNLHEFTFTPIQARYVQLFVVNNWGSPSFTLVYDFEVWTRDREGGIVSLRDGPPASIAGFSSQYSIYYKPENMIDENPSFWYSASGQNTNQWVKVSLGGGQIYTIDRVKLLSTGYNSDVKDFEIRVSNTTVDDNAFVTVFSGTAANNNIVQEFTFAPVQARYVQLFIKNNYGGPYVAVSTFQVMTPDGANVARLEGVGAFVVSYSSQYDISYGPEKAIDFDTNSYWITANGQTTNQWFKVLLIEGAPYLIDRVRLKGSNIKDFQIRVSNASLNDSDFITIFNGTLSNDGLSHWFTFPPVEAKYVQLFILNSYSSIYDYVYDFQVYSPLLGGQIVPFDDFSVDPAGQITSWNWDFGDGSTSAQQHPVHTYAASGAYPVVLTVTDNSDNTGTATMNYTVLQTPIVNFTWSPIIPNEGQTTYFNDASIDTDGSIVGWKWQFPNLANQGTTQNTYYSFPDNGSFPVNLTVTDSQLLTANVTKTVTALNLPPTVYAGPNLTLFWGENWAQKVSPSVSDPGYNDLSSLICNWNFGDGQTAQVFNCSYNNIRVAHSYANPGNYTATLMVTDKDGASASGSLNVAVNKRNSSIDFYNATAGGKIEVAAKLSDDFDVGTYMLGRNVTFTLGSQTVNATTNDYGIATPMLTFVPNVENIVNSTFAGDSFYNPNTSTFSSLKQTPLGDVIGKVTFSQSCPPTSTPGVGIAYDGINLWYSCLMNQTDLIRADINGKVTASYQLNQGLAALAYDATRNVIWAAGYTYNYLFKIQLDQGKNVTGITKRFTLPTGGGIDGLAFDAMNISDPNDDIFYYGPDAKTTIQVINITGYQVENFPEAPPYGACAYGSGLAIGGNLLFEAQGWCDHVWVVNKTTKATVFDFSTKAPGDTTYWVEGMACDPNTFSPIEVIWAVDAFSPTTAKAFVIPKGTCGTGGLPPNTIPIAYDQIITTNENTQVSINLTASDKDGDALSFSTVALPVNGTLSGTAPNLTYTPNTGFSGSDSFTFKANDGKADSNIATVSIIVKPAPPTQDTTPPVIDSITLNQPNVTVCSIMSIDVHALDNTGVVNVTANDVPLTNSSGIWQGSLNAPYAVGNYIITIRAKDGAGNEVVNSTSYEVTPVQAAPIPPKGSVPNGTIPQGGVSIAIIPKISNVVGGNCIDLTIKINSTENFDDIFYIYMNNSALSSTSRADQAWFNWLSTAVSIPSRNQTTIPMRVGIPSNISATKSFRIYANSTKWRSTAYDTGGLKPAKLVSIAVTPQNPTIALGYAQQFNATGTYSEGSTKDITSLVNWSSSNISIATINTWGLATSVTTGSTLITATSDGITGNQTLTVASPKLVSIAVTPQNVTISLGQIQQFNATGTYSDGSTKDITSNVTWSSSNTSVAAINASGLATSVATGSTLITATSDGVTSNQTLTVTSTKLVSIAIIPQNATIALGQTQQFNATATYSDGSTKDITSSVTWLSSDNGVATINAAGLAKSASVGTTQITATSSGIISPAQTLTVTPPKLVSINVTPQNSTIALGQSQQFIATGTYSDSSIKDITSNATWSSENTNVAAISASGLATSMAVGTTKITAASDGITSPDQILTVTSAKLVSIAVTPQNPTIALGYTQQFTATATYSDSSTKDITSSANWSSSNTNIAAINISGLATSMAVGTTKITATSDGITSPDQILTVTPAKLVSIAVTPQNPTIALGQIQQFNATGTYSDGSTKDITPSTNWSSSNASVATIDTLGLARSKAAGSSLITASSDGITSPAQMLNITSPKLVSIAVIPQNPTIGLDQTQQFTATETYSDGSTKDITSSANWSSSNISVATINASGLATSVSTGSTLITATSSGITGNQTLTVTSTKLVSIAVAPVNSTIELGQTQQFTATGTYSNGSTQDITSLVTWSSSNISVATISASGLATSVAAGITQITAASEGITSPVQMLTVTSAKLISIAIAPVNPTIYLNQIQQFTATGTYSDGSTKDITSSSTWSSSNTSVATINASGLATSIGVGKTNITASNQGITSPAQILTVNSVPDLIRPIVNITVVPLVANVSDNVTIVVNATDNVGIISKALTINGVPVPLDFSGKANYSSSKAGVFTAVGTAFDAAGNEGLDKKEFRFLSPGDTTPPTVAIDSPADNSNLSVPTNITGTASDANLTIYKLEYSVKDKNEFITFANGTSSVMNGILGTLDPTTMRNGLYDIRLTAEDASGNKASITRTYLLEGEMKVGIFTISFNDLTIPVAGIPITITRTYDSRVKSKGDFGIGWSLDIKDIELSESRVMGTDWSQTNVGGFIPTYVLQETKPHYVTITYPDGRTEEFDMKVDPESQELQPLDATSTYFVNRSDTFSSLIPLDGSPSNLLIQPQIGNVQLLSPNFDSFNPNQYQLTAMDGTIYTINQQNGLEKIVDNNGNTITFSYDGIIHSAGKSVKFTRDAKGRITNITDPMGNTIKYEYDYYGDLIRVTDQEGYTTRFTYNSDHSLVDIIDPRGIRAARTEYDDKGRVIANIDADGNRIEYTHNIGTRQEVVKDRLGSITVYEYDDKGNVVQKTDPMGGVTGYTYDARGNKLSETDPLGHITNYTYDSNNNLLSQTDPLGNTVRYTYNIRGQVLTTTDAMGNVTTNTYDARGNLINTTDPLGYVTSSEYDAAGNLVKTTDALGGVTNYTYDGTSNMLSKKDPLGNVITYTYDANGNKLSETTTRTTSSGTETITTSYVYDKANRLVQTTDPYGNKTTTEYNAIGKEVATIDKLGNRMEREYDTRGNLVLMVYPDGTDEHYTYDAENRKSTSTDRSGRTTSYTYDKLGRMIKTTYPDGNFTQSEYDAAGRITRVINERGNPTRYTYDAAGRQNSIIDALGNTTAYTYDKNGNQIQMTDARGSVFQYQYNAGNRRIKTIFPDSTLTSTSYDALGRKVSETDQADNTVQFEYDSLGRLVKATDALGQVTTYTYDANGNMISQTDANGHTTSFEYDKLGRRTKRTLPLGMSETTAYDSTGNVVSQTDFNGNTTTFTYDANSRLTKKNFPDGASDTFTYTAGGQRKNVTDSRGVTSYEYDVRDRLIKQTEPDGRDLSYTYDAAGNRVSLTIPSGTTSYTFDALNRLSTVTDPNGGVTSYTYDAVGNRKSVTYPNGVVAEYTYDSLNRLTYLLNRKSGGEVISSYAYTLGPAGNRVKAVENTGRTVNYTYDKTYKLTNESINDPISGSRAINYSYDAVGNRLTKIDDGITTTYSYDANDRLLTEIGNTYTYDNNGNTISKSDGNTVTNYAYDYENRLITAQTGANQITYRYDTDGIRMQSTANGNITNYLVDKNRDYAQVLEETDGTGSMIVGYIYGDDLISQKRSGSLSYYHYDGQMSIRKLTNVTGTITDSYVYNGFGVLIDQAGTTINNYLYTGEQYDLNMGFYYLRTRYYNAEVGRFISLDTWNGDLFDPASLHKYVYVKNDPTNKFDPNGKFGISLIEISIVIIIASVISSCTSKSSFKESSMSRAQIEGEQAQNAAIAMLRHVDKALKDPVYFRLWFGDNIRSRNEIELRFNVIKSLSTKQYTFLESYSPCGKQDLAACVDTPHTITLNPRYFYDEAILRKKFDHSKGSTLIHELAHKAYIQGEDIGRSISLNLARNSPSEAIENADNYVYFAEDWPTYQLFGVPWPQ